MALYIQLSSSSRSVLDIKLILISRFQPSSTTRTVGEFFIHYWSAGIYTRWYGANYLFRLLGSLWAMEIKSNWRKCHFLFSFANSEGSASAQDLRPDATYTYFIGLHILLVQKDFDFTGSQGCCRGCFILIVHCATIFADGYFVIFFYAGKRFRQLANARQVPAFGNDLQGWKQHHEVSLQRYSQEPER